MTNAFNPVVQVSELELQSFKHGENFESRDAGLSEVLRLSKIGAAYSEVPPGKSSCPFHVHHVEDEMFFILEGAGTYRFGEERYSIIAGDVLGAPNGEPKYAHQIINTGSVALKYLSISSVSETEVCEYPDSGKFAVFSRRSLGDSKRFRFVGRDEDSRDYWEGEVRPE